MSRFRRSSLALLVTASVLAGLLSACTTGALSIATKVTLFTDEYWKAQADIAYSDQQMQLMGRQIEQGLGSSISQWKAQGIRASYSRRTLGDGSTQFRLTASGQGFAKLNAALFDNLATIRYDATTVPPQIEFSYVPLGTFFSAALSRTFTLTGGKILSSNGTAASDAAVTWVNPLDVMEATLTPASQFAWAAILLAGGGLLLAGLIVAGVRRGHGARCSVCGARLARRADYCTNCGAPKD